MGQETRFGCEIEDCGSGEYQHKESLEFLFAKPLGCRVNDSTEAVWRRPRDTAGDLTLINMAVAVYGSHFFRQL